MNQKTPYILVLIGVILGFFVSLLNIFKYFLFKSEMFGLFSDFYSLSGFDFDILLKISLIMSFIGILFSIILIFYVVKISKNPVKKDFIIITVLGGVGALLGMGIGGILVLVGGIIGITKSNESEEKTAEF